MSLIRRGSIAAADAAAPPTGIEFVKEIGTDASGSTSTPTLTIGSSITIPVGSFLTAYFAAVPVINSFSDSQSNTWQIDVNYSGTWHVGIASCKVTTQLTTGDTIVMHLASSNAFHGFVVDQWTGLASSSWFGAASALLSHASTTARATNSVTATAGALVFGVWGLTGGGDGGFTAGTGYTVLKDYTTPGPDGLQAEYQIDSGSGGSYAPSATGNSHHYDGFAAYYKAA